MFEEGGAETGFGKWEKEDVAFPWNERTNRQGQCLFPKGKERQCICLQPSSAFTGPGSLSRYFGSSELWVAPGGSRGGQLHTAGWESAEK